MNKTSLVVSLAFLVQLPCLLAQEQDSSNPNLVIFVADDLGWNDVSYHGSEIETPNIDRLAREGVELDRFYAYPKCSPTRTALMTGRSPLSIGISSSIPDFAPGLPTDEHIMAESFRAAGYQTFITGKWHLGANHVKYWPQQRGFDYFYGHLMGTLHYYNHVLRGRLDWQRNGKTIKEEGYTTELIGKEAVKLLETRNKSMPVFLYVAFNAPHFPLVAPPEYISKYEHIMDDSRRVYAAMVDAMDVAIGSVLRTLDREDMRENTLVVFLSDNGGSLRFGGSNTPLRGEKGSAFEGGIRVPATMRWPGVLRAGTKSGQIVAAHDLFPTLAAACGIKTLNTKPFYGQNLWPVLKEGLTQQRDDFLIGSGSVLALFHKKWKYVTWADAETGKAESALFRILEDPYEQKDLADENPQLVRQLQIQMDASPNKDLMIGLPRRPFTYERDPAIQPAAEAAARN